jgi:hypothetical protein
MVPVGGPNLDGRREMRHGTAYDGEHAFTRDFDLRDHHYRLATLLAEAVLA